jgi:hypothetical protein
MSINGRNYSNIKTILKVEKVNQKIVKAKNGISAYYESLYCHAFFKIETYINILEKL